MRSPVDILRMIFGVVIVCVFGTAALGQPWAGSGTAEDPYQIWDACDMQAIGADSNYWDAHFVLCADINLGEYMGTSFNIIGTVGNPFMGVFDGNEHTISNFTYDSNGADYVGIFGFVYDTNAEIKDVGLINPDVNTETGNVAGSLVGWIESSIISGCWCDGVSIRGGNGIGGLIGYNSGGVISNCYSSGTVDGNDWTGGLISGTSPEGSIISSCYSDGSIFGKMGVGGLIGWTGGTVSNCYSNSNVSGEEVVGGLLAEAIDYSQVVQCYSTGSVLGNDSVGGLIGDCVSDEVVVRDCYWDVDTSGCNSSAGGIGKTTEEMQDSATYVFWGCDSIWTIDEGDYPRLWWENKPGEFINLGCGTGNEPYLLSLPSNIQVLSDSPQLWDKHFKLMADIDLGDFTDTFHPIGNDVNVFIGVFDGNGHSISNFTYNRNFETEQECIGFFGEVGYWSDFSGEIKNLGLIAPDCEPNSAVKAYYVGGLVGALTYGTVSGCYVKDGNVSGGESVGGLIGGAGYYLSVITNCYFTGNVSGQTRAGGLVGDNDGEVNDCYSASVVSGSGFVGGLVGLDGGVYTSCFWDVNVNPDVNGIGNTMDPNVIGKTTAEMQMESTFTDAGWDFVGELVNGPNDIWTICEGTNYPKFVWQKRAADFVCPDGVNFVDYAFFAEYWLQKIYGDCDGVELTGDGKVNWVDFDVFAEYWGQSGCGECGGADFTGEGDVDLADLDVFSEHWLQIEYAEVDLTKDGQVGLDDLGEFTENWLTGL